MAKRKFFTIDEKLDRQQMNVLKAEVDEFDAEILRQNERTRRLMAVHKLPEEWTRRPAPRVYQGDQK